MARKPTGGGRARNPNASPRNIPAMREKMWKPGQSGNPKGPPPRRSLEAIVQQLLDEQIGIGADTMTRREALATVIIDEMINRRNSPIIKELLSRLWPAAQDVNVNASGQLVVVFDDQDRELFDAIESGRGLDIGLDDDETGEGDGDG